MCLIGIALRLKVNLAWKKYFPKGGNIKPSQEYENVCNELRRHVAGCSICRGE